jgi:hypothetical protein
MKRAKLMQHLRKHGCELVREGARHSIWRNPEPLAFQPVIDIPNVLARQLPSFRLKEVTLFGETKALNNGINVGEVLRLGLGL